MKFTIVAIIAAISSVAVAQSPRPWCNRGTAGNGKCEEAGLHTFCCAAARGGNYVNEKQDAYDAGIGACDNGQGTAMCAA